jgi:predicted nucleic acid-binding protein
MKVYFDTCCLGRPFDDRSVPRTAVEREAIIVMFEMIPRRELELVISDVVLDESRRTPDEDRRTKLESLVGAANSIVSLSSEIISRGIELAQRGFRAYDALHLASAEAVGVDCVCTCDDRFRKKCLSQNDLRTRVVSVLELFQELQI